MRLEAAILLLLARTAAAEVLELDAPASHVRVHLGRAGLAGFLGHDHDIEAPVTEGRLEIVDSDPSRSSVRLAFEAARLAVVPGSEPEKDVPKVEARMRGPEVLDTAAHPAITFESSAVRERPGAAGRDGSAADGVRHLIVRGTLRLRGRPYEVELPVDVRSSPEGLLGSGEAKLQLEALGIRPPSVAGVVKVANRFRLSYELRFRKAGADTAR
jgi:polyisoprenoid-binding protein YceI